MDDRKRNPLRLGRELVAEAAAQERVDHGVQPLLGKAVPVLLGLPDAEVPQAALGPLDGKMDDESLRGSSPSPTRTRL